MAPLRSMACFAAVSVGTFCGAFVAPGPAQVVSRHTAPTTTTALSRSIVLQSNFGSPPSRALSRATVPQAAVDSSSGLFSRKGVNAAGSFSSSPGGRAAPSGLLRSAKEERQRQPAGALEAVPGSGGGGVKEGGRDLTGLRRALLASLWLPLVVYAFGPWSPGGLADPNDIEIVTHLYDTLTPETTIFFSVFNGLGVLPAVMVSLLSGGGAFTKGRQPVPPEPFVFGAFALGFFALGPYLALRNYLPEVDAEGEMSGVEKAFTGKITAALLLAGASYCLVNFLSGLTDPAAVAGYTELFWSSKLAHISSLDELILSVAIVDPLREDMVRRGWEPEAAKVALFAVPLVGPALWLLVRPAVVRE